jgi:hypothetical protein
MISHGWPDQDRRWSAYRDTILEIRDERRVVTVDLRQSLAMAEHQALRSLKVGCPFGVVTAANPIGRQLSDAENAARSAALRARLDGDGIRYLPADGLSPDRSHGEAGFAIHAPCQALRSIAEEFEQSAFFWFDGDAFWLVPTPTDRDAIRLPRGS